MWADRLSYSVFALTLPRMNESQRISAVLLRLSSLYPYRCVKDQIRLFKNSHVRNGWIVIVFACRTEQKRLSISTLAAVCRLRSFSGTAYVLSDTCVETLVLENGGLVSSSASGAVQILPDAVRGGNIPVFVPLNGVDSCREKYGATADVRALNERNVGCYDVHVYSYTPGDVVRRILPRLLAVLLCAGAAAAGINIYVQTARDGVESRRAADDEVRAAAAARAKELARLEEVKAVFSADERKQHIPVYTVCSVVYGCLGDSTLIDNLSIAGNTFQLDAHDVNALRILKKFEQNAYVSTVRMNRTARDEGMEFFSIKGELRKPVPIIDDSLPVRDLIVRYENEIESRQLLREKRSRRSPSEFAEGVRSLLRRNGCSEAYMQFMQSESGIDLECSVTASSRNLLRFLQRAAETAEPYDFSEVRLKSSGIKDEVTAYVRIRTGIPQSAVKEGELSALDGRIAVSVKPETMSTAFFRPSPVPSEPVAPAPVPAAAPRQVTRNPGFISYLGMAGGADGMQYVFIKNTRSGEVLTIPVDSDGERSCTILGDTRLRIRLDDAVYEVDR